MSRPAAPVGQNARVTADHYFSADPAGATRQRPVTFTAGGRDYEVTAGAGVFSAGRLDPGTAVLLHKAPLPTDAALADGDPTSGRPALLDLGCGYGPITCVLADAAPGATVWAVDVNARARDLTRNNAAAIGAAERVRVCAPDEVPADLRFSEIWSNPPIRIGKEELHALLDRWLPRLRPDGTAWLVVARHLGGDSLQAWLQGQGWIVERHASQKGFRILRVTPKTD
jgi:16S rRNA (guanine1207-N2)-methyltransferase